MRDPAALNIVIAGGGTAGWMAAATFARFLGNTASITLVESDAIGIVGVGEATIPQIHNLLIGLGIDQADFLRRTNASFKLGIEFADWLRPGQSYIHSFGQVGRGVGLIPFRQLWLRAQALGVAGDYGDYSVNVAAARLGCFAIGEGQGGKLPDLAYAYHLDATLFAQMLRDYAEERGVTRIEGKIASVERDGDTGDIRALKLDGERRIAGNLFIDCTGFRSLLLGDALGVAFDDWSAMLPCDTALAVPSQTRAALDPYTRSTARAAGWQWRIPLQHRTGNGHVFCSYFTSVDEASALLLANLDGPALADPRPIRFTTGRRQTPWSHNCVALGLAAGFMEPLESTSIHLVQSGIGRLLNLLSHDLSDVAAARASFNRLSEIEWRRVRDFLLLHYVANARVGEPFWDHCRSIPLPDTLAEKIAIFRETGGFMREEDELFLDDSWGQVMLGQGIAPRAWSLLADNVAAAEIGPFLASLGQACALKAQSLPRHRDFIAAMLKTKTEQYA
ncbi:tryptophan halogenase family protein [Sphingomonas sp. PAMC 26605]|uniref:tryptophan halogenase family protein n=1 Tax=Sphingomonas sp. PAMC 26605 TaxID=1112214 RepID=UPI00026CAC43|nr:tryptophan halogenase family protein [Sphingomonas sp. PAMC 26605]